MVSPGCVVDNMPDLKTRRRGFESHSGHKKHIFRTSVARGKKHLVLLNHLKTFKAWKLLLCINNFSSYL